MVEAMVLINQLSFAIIVWIKEYWKFAINIPMNIECWETRLHSIQAAHRPYLWFSGVYERLIRWKPSQSYLPILDQKLV